MTTTHPTTPDQGDERRAFVRHIQATEQRTPALWSDVFASSLHKEPCPPHLEGMYFQVADQKAWLAWQAAIAAEAGKVKEAYWQGWCEAADWANRDDLRADRDSQAYADAMNRRLAKLSVSQPSQEAQDPFPGDLCLRCYGSGKEPTRAPVEGTGKEVPQPAEPVTDVKRWREALEYYAAGNHFIISDDDAWDTVSGEPQNFLCDEAGTATVEDGEVARAALMGYPLQNEDGTPYHLGSAPQEASKPLRFHARVKNAQCKTFERDFPAAEERSAWIDGCKHYDNITNIECWETK